MNIQAIQNGSLDYAIIDGLYSNDELTEAQKEIEFLQCIKQEPFETNTAINHNGESLKTGKGIFVDTVYADRSNSVLLRINRKLFAKEVVDYLVSKSAFYEHIRQSTYDSTLLNFYGNQEKYDGHRDRSVFTALTFFAIGKFSGGEFLFPEHGVTIRPEVGRVVIFPGCVLHETAPTTSGPLDYRVTMAQFIGYKKGRKHG